MVTSTFLADYHGLHVAAPCAQVEPVDWEPSRPRADRVRVREHTCSCRRPVFELCAAGGLWFVRRLSDDTSAVMESAWLSVRAAEELWSRILRGQAR